ncbi:MAG: polysaccharide pyruvyl transferase family protein [Muribaculaceae bacterium]|nr:polysaccharide pyruvyl transferase family protein [Muribaculaceae bacterium]
MKKAGIITFEFNYNYGAILQATALADVVRSHGYAVEIVDRGWGITPPQCNNRLSISKLVGKYYSLRALEGFKRRHWTLSRKVQADADIARLLDSYDRVITGSDQIWNSACVPTMGLYYFGCHAAPEKVVAYAPSFGHKRFDADAGCIGTLRAHLQRCRALSVREADGLELLRTVFGIEGAERVLDPTMLHDADYYRRLAGVRRARRTRTLAYYLLDHSPEKQAAVERLAAAHGLKPVSINKPVDNGVPVLGRLRALRYPSVENWLRKIDEAAMVVTDSFHGTVFSILFEKRFVAFGNEKRGNSRFHNLLGMFGLEHRLTTPELCDSVAAADIDYAAVRTELQRMRARSMEYIDKALR